MTTDKLRAAICDKIGKRTAPTELKAIAGPAGIKAETLKRLITGGNATPGTIIKIAGVLGLQLTKHQQVAFDIYNFRREHGIGQHDLARAAKCANETISLVESGYGCSPKIAMKIGSAIAEIQKQAKAPAPVTLFETSYNETVEALKKLGIGGDAAKPEPAPRWDFGALGALDDEISGPNNSAPVGIKPVPSANPYKSALLRLADLLEDVKASITPHGISFGLITFGSQDDALTPDVLRRLAKQFND